jgi:hypothetical protein
MGQAGSSWIKNDQAGCRQLPRDYSENALLLERRGLLKHGGWEDFLSLL